MVRGQKGKVWVTSKSKSKERRVTRRGDSFAGTPVTAFSQHPTHTDHENTVFTLRDAARARNADSSWTTTANLRHRTIGFVRSNIEPPGNSAEDRLQEQRSCLSAPEEDNGRESLQDATESPHVGKQSGKDPAILPAVFATPNLHRSPSPTPSDSSNDVVLFEGRSQAIITQHHQSTLPHLTGIPFPPQDYIPLASANTICRDPLATQLGATEAGNNTDLQAGLDDYIANMRENGYLDRTVGVSADSGWGGRDGWTSSDLRDFDEMSTSDGVMGSLQAVVSKRYRAGSLQYLVVWEGNTIDEARWVPRELLVMEGADDLISTFEKRSTNIANSSSCFNDTGSRNDEVDFPASADQDSDSEEDSVENDGCGEWGEDDSQDEGSGDSDFGDDDDLIERRLARLSDERLARLLAKQEELGMGSQELLLFDGVFADDGENPGDMDVELQLAIEAGQRRSSKRHKQSKRRLDFLEGFDEVMMFGDDGYGDFDVMDRTRPSIDHTRNKADPTSWGLSDSDQANALQSAWIADRHKKKAKKREREELRGQGLLGKKNKFKPDLRTKYRDGMDVNQLGLELRTFLFGAAESQALPPMDKRDRKIIHEVASTFGLKSLSKGSGRSRFTTLQKTTKTVEFDEEVYARLQGKLARRFYPRMERASKGREIGARGSGGAFSSTTAGFKYRDGEVVGGSAPEIGSDNRGRAMLEKMGWTTGNALGTLENKGILQPIAHVIRNSRAGLG